MTVESFVDTNVLVYAAAPKPGEESKRKVAAEVLRSQTFAISAQVLQEFYTTVTRHNRHEELQTWMKRLRSFTCAAIDRDHVYRATEVSVRYRISYWDASIIASAALLGASTLYSEDLNHGQAYNGVTVINPFFDLDPPKGFNQLA
jgi:predicted nucleic acid-binding protein